MDIIPIYDSSVANAPAGYKAAVQAAISFIDHLIVNPITVHLTFSYGVLNGHTLSRDALGESSTNGNIETYASLYGYLTAAATSTADKQSLAALPSPSTTDPINGGRFWVSDTQAKVFGLGSEAGYTDPQDGFVALSSSAPLTYDPNSRAVSGKYDAIGILEHEITEAIGRISYLGQNGTFQGFTLWSPLDLFRYSGAGHHAYTVANSSETDFFSVDGQHMLLQYNNPDNGGDGGDWDSSIAGDAFGSGYDGVSSGITPPDVLELDLLGYQIGLPRSTDFNNDGLSNLLIQNTNGSVLAGEVSGANVAWSQLGGLGKEWTFLTNGDFLGDGQSQYLLESTSGAVVVGEVGPDVTATYTQVATLGKEWTIEGAGNLLGDGRFDVLMWNTNGAVVIGEADPMTSQLAFTQVGGLGHEWSYRGVGDYLGEGHAQILLENATGAVYVGDAVNGVEQYTSLGGLGPEWTFVESGDFLGDSKTDFLLQNTNGALVVGEVGSNHVVSYTTIGSLGPEWKFVGAGDYTGAGHAEFLIQNTAGAVVVGNVVSGSAQYTTVTGLGAEWAFHG